MPISVCTLEITLVSRDFALVMRVSLCTHGPHIIPQPPTVSFQLCGCLTRSGWTLCPFDTPEATRGVARPPGSAHTKPPSDPGPTCNSCPGTMPMGTWMAKISGVPNAAVKRKRFEGTSLTTQRKLVYCVGADKPFLPWHLTDSPLKMNLTQIRFTGAMLVGGRIPPKGNLLWGAHNSFAMRKGR